MVFKMKVEVSEPDKVSLESATKYDNNIYVFSFWTTSKYCDVQLGGGYDPEKGIFETIIFQPEYIGYEHPLIGTVNLMDSDKFPPKRFEELFELRMNHPDYWRVNVDLMDIPFELPHIQWTKPMKYAYEIGIIDLEFLDKAQGQFTIRTEEQGKYKLTEESMNSS